MPDKNRNISSGWDTDSSDIEAMFNSALGVPTEGGLDMGDIGDIDAMFSPKDSSSYQKVSSLKDIIKHETQDSLTGRAVRGAASLFKEDKSEPLKETVYTPFKENPLRSALEHTVATGTNIAVDAIPFALLETATAGLATPFIGAAKVAEAAKGAGVLAKLVKGGLESAAKVGVPMAAYEAIKNPLTQIQETGEYNPVENLKAAGEGFVGGTAFGAGTKLLGKGIKTVFGKEVPKLSELDTTIESGLSKKSISKPDLLDEIDAITGVAKEEQLAREEMLAKNRAKLIEGADETQQINILNPVAKQLENPRRVITEGFDKAGIDGAEKFMSNAYDALRANDAMIADNEFALGRELRSLEKLGVKGDDLYEHIKNVEAGGKITNPDMLLNFKDPNKAAEHLKNIRTIFDTLYNKVNDKDFNKLESYVSSKLETSELPEVYKNKIKANLLEIRNKIDLELKANPMKSNTLDSIISSHKKYYEMITSGIKDKGTLKDLLPKKDIINPTVNERPRIDAYIRQTRKPEYNLAQNRDVTVINANRATNKLQESPTFTMARGEVGIPDSQLEKNVFKIGKKYITQASNYLNLGELTPQVETLISELKSVREFSKPMLEGIKPKLGKAFTNAIDTIRSSKVEVNGLGSFENLVKREFEGVMGRAITPKESRLIEQFFKLSGKQGEEYSGALAKVLKFANRKDIDYGGVLNTVGKLDNSISALEQVIKISKSKTPVKAVEETVGVLRGAVEGMSNKEAQSALLSQAGTPSTGESPLISLLKGQQADAIKNESKLLLKEAVDSTNNIIKLYEESNVKGSKNAIYRIKEKLSTLNKLPDKKKIKELKAIRKIINPKEDINELGGLLKNTEKHFGSIQEVKNAVDAKGKEALDGILGRHLEKYFDMDTPELKTDLEQYFRKWFDDAVGISNDPTTYKVRKKVIGVLKYWLPEEGKQAVGVKQKIAKMLGENINPDATWDDVVDMAVSQMYTNLMGWKITPFLRNMTQFHLVSKPAINVPLLWQVGLEKDAALKLTDKTFRQRFIASNVNSKELISEMGSPRENAFSGIIGKILDYKRQKLDKIGMYLWKQSDTMQRIYTFAYGEAAAEKALNSSDPVRYVKKLLANPYVRKPERAMLMDILAKGTPESKQEFATAYAKMITDNTQFVYSKFASAGIQREGKAWKILTMFSKWPLEITSREFRYAKALFNKDSAVDASGALAKDILYGASLIALGRVLGLDLRDWHPLTSVEGKYTPPAVGLVVDPSWRRVQDLALPNIPKSIARTVGHDIWPTDWNKDRQPITGIKEYKRGVPNTQYENSAVGMLANMLSGGKKKR